MVEAKEPLLLGEVKKGSHFWSSLSYIPGRVLRGAWANWLITQGKESEIIEKMAQIRIGNFFPTVEWRPIQYVSPLLFTALSCKQKGGFATDPLRRGDGVIDILLPYLAYRLLRDESSKELLPFTVKCKKCESRMEPFGGSFTLYEDESKRYYVRTRLYYHAQTKVALSRFRRAVVEGMLYTATALSPVAELPDAEKERAPLVFLGRVEGPGQLIEELCQALNTVAIGSLHNRGYGKVGAKVNLEVRGFPPLAERFETFNRLLGELWEDLKQLVGDSTGVTRPQGYYFSLDLLAPGLFRKNGLPRLVPALVIKGQVLEPVLWFTRPGFAGGWSTAWGLPKGTHLAAQMGSVYVFHWQGAKEELLPALQRLEAEGVGEQREEGFGECLICHPLHQEVDEM